MKFYDLSFMSFEENTISNFNITYRGVRKNVPWSEKSRVISQIKFDKHMYLFMGQEACFYGSKASYFETPDNGLLHFYKEIY